MTNEQSNHVASCVKCGREQIGIRLSDKKYTCVFCGVELPI